MVSREFLLFFLPQVFLKSFPIDVETIPENGTWFQHIQNGTVAINNGANGLQRLDKIVKSAQDHGIYLIMSLTNNWNPQGLADNSTIGVVSHHAARNNNNSTTNVTPKIRNKLSNDYGMHTRLLIAPLLN